MLINKCLSIICFLPVAYFFADYAHAFTDSEDLRRKEAISLMAAGEYDAAKEILEEMSKKGLSSALVRNEQQKLLGQVQLRLEDYNGAIASFTNVIDFPRAERTTALINRCYAYLQLNLLLDAQRDCSEGRHIIERVNLTNLSKDTSEGTQAFRQISLSMVEAEIFVNLGQPEQALEVLYSSREIVEDANLEIKNYWGLLLSIAEISSSIGQYKNSLKILDEIEHIIPNTERHRLLAARASTLRGMGDVDGAVTNWTDAYNASLEVGHHAETNIGYLFLACAHLIQEGRNEDALSPCNAAAEANPKSALYAEANAFAITQAYGLSAGAKEINRATQLSLNSPIRAFVAQKLFEQIPSVTGIIENLYDLTSLEVESNQP